MLDLLNAYNYLKAVLNLHKNTHCLSVDYNLKCVIIKSEISLEEFQTMFLFKDFNKWTGAGKWLLINPWGIICDFEKDILIPYWDNFTYASIVNIKDAKDSIEGIYSCFSQKEIDELNLKSYSIEDESTVHNQCLQFI